MNVTMCFLLLKTPAGAMKLQPEAQFRAEMRDAYISVCPFLTPSLQQKQMRNEFLAFRDTKSLHAAFVSGPCV
jgi:hypothetical protein